MLHPKDVEPLIEELLEEIVEKAQDLFKDEHPEEDGIRVETYGYEAEYNSAIKDIITLIKETK